MSIIINGDTGVSGVDGSAATPSYQGTDTNAGIFYPAADTVAFGTSGSERMRIDSGGNVGIRTTTISSRLDINSTLNWNFSVSNLIRSASNNANPRFLGMTLDGDSLTSTTIGAYNAIWGAYDSAPTTGSTSAALNGAMVYGAYAGHRWVNNGTEAMRITSTGGVNVGTYSADPGTGNMNVTGTVAMGSSFLRNRIINGDMRIDQRNAGASGTALSYTVDRWNYFASQASKFTWQQNAGSVTPPASFTNYLGFTSSSAYTVLTSDYFNIEQRIEGFNVADLAWGTANARTVTLSFWVRSSLTGTFGGSITNSAGSRSYAYTYTISSANTWEQKTVTIAGDTTGTWLSTNGTGMRVIFSLGVGSTYAGTAGSWASTDYEGATGQTQVVGTNGATFYITGVQLEIGTSATPFERRLYGQELALCQRYYWRFNALGNATIFSAGGLAVSTTRGDFAIQNPVSMRVVPSAIDYASLGITLFGTSTTAVTSAILVTSTGESSLNFTVVSATVASGLTQFRPYNLSSSSASGYIGATAEL